MAKIKKTYYIITYRDPEDSKICTLKAGKVCDSSLGISFVSISDFVFDTDSLVVNPEEETLKKRLEHVNALHLSIYAIISIKEVGPDHKGLKFQTDKSKLVVLPGSEQTGPKK